MTAHKNKVSHRLIVPMRTEVEILQHNRLDANSLFQKNVDESTQKLHEYFEGSNINF